MKKIYSLILVFVLLMSFASCTKDNQSTKKHDGLVLSIETDKEIYTAEETVHITATIENKSGKTIYQETTFLPHGKIHIDVIVYIPNGQKVHLDFDHNLVMGSSVFENNESEKAIVKLSEDILDHILMEYDNFEAGEYTAVAEVMYSFEKLEEGALPDEHQIIRTECKFTVE